MRLSIAAAVCASIVVAAVADPAAATIKKFTNIAAQDLGSALQELAQEHDVQVVYLSDGIDKLRTAGAVGEFTAEQALSKLLKGTGLSYRYLDEHTLTVIPAPPAPAVSAERKTQLMSSAEASQTDAAAAAAAGAGVWERLRLAQREQDSSPAAGNPSPAAEQPIQLEEVLVTAQKNGEERLLDVPVPVSVVDTASLTQTGQVLLRDWYSSVPNLNIAPTVDGTQLLVIRGIATSTADVPAVGVVLDDAPFGTQSYNSSSEFPEIDPGELDHIEVLRGPQGTLYGANSMGGLVKIVTKDPSTAGFSGQIEAGASGIQHGAQPGFDLHGSLNVPISATLAVRASAFQHQDPGYIDNPTLGLRGVNERQNAGGRLAALWQPADSFSLKLSALYQDSHLYGASEADALPGLGDLQQSRIANTGWETRNVQAYSAIANAHFGKLELVSVTGYNSNSFNSALDYTFSLGPVAQSVYQAGGAPFFFHLEDQKLTQELRLKLPIGTRLSWEVGGYYTHEKKPNYGLLRASVPETGKVVGDLGRYAIAAGYQEYSGFTNLTVQITDRLDVQLGGRESHTEVTTPENISTGIFVGVAPATNASANTFTYLATPRFKITPDVMVYARFASGFRPGTANSSVVIVKGAPAAQAPDTTKNYELGLKADFLNHSLLIDTSLYYIDWSDIQLGLTTGDGFTYAANGGTAKSAGAELSVTARPWHGSTLSTWLVYQDAALTESLPINSTAVGQSGDRLPFSSRFSSNLALEQSFPLSQGVDGFVSGAVSYMGDRIGPFQATPQRQIFPAYTKADLKAGVNVKTWTVNLYANNVLNRRGFLDGGIGYTPDWARVYITPRTIGLSVTNTF